MPGKKCQLMSGPQQAGQTQSIVQEARPGLHRELFGLLWGLVKRVRGAGSRFLLVMAWVKEVLLARSLKIATFGTEYHSFSRPSARNKHSRGMAIHSELLLSKSDPVHRSLKIRECYPVSRTGGISNGRTEQRYLRLPP
jgi:hypothetical protein